MKLFLKIVLPVLAVFLVTSCSDDNSSNIPEEEPEVVLSSENTISNFELLIGEEQYTLDIKNDTISFAFPASVDLSIAKTNIKFPEKATISPKPEVIQDFTKPVNYTVTAENGDVKKYVVNLSSNDAREGNSIRRVQFNDINGPYSSSFNYDENLVTIRIDLPYLTPLTALTSIITLSDGATIVPASGETLDYTNPVAYTVTAENGNERNYLIITNNRLEQVKMPPVSGNQFFDKKPGDLITFSTNVLNPIEENNKVNLIDKYKPNAKIALTVESVDYDTNTLAVRLPQNYLNSNYNLEIFVEDDNTDVSDSFRLDKGTPNFIYVDTFKNENGDSVSYGSVLSPGENISATVFVDDSRFDQYNFYLRKGAIDIALSEVVRIPNFYDIGFSIPDLATQNITGGSDFKLVIEIDGVKTAYDFINDQNQTINIVVAKTPAISSLVTSTVKKGQNITLAGSYLYYPVQPNTRSVFYLDGSQLKLTATSGSKTYELESTDSSSDQINFLVSDEIQAGTYTISFRNNIKSFDWVDTGLSVNITLPDSEHPTISATNAIIYINSTSGLYLQLRVEFNQNIETVNIDRLLFAGDTIDIGNYFSYPTSVLTGKVSGEQANAIIANPDGKAIITDAGVSYEIPFTIVVEN